MNKNKILEKLQEIKPILKDKFDVQEIFLVGSYAKNNFNKDSDIDLIVEMPASFDKFFDLKYFLEKTFNKKIDLAIKGSIRNYIKKDIEKDMINV
jgi:predicted nucleotidyltransferase